MVDPVQATPVAPVLSPLQRAWLREIGMDKIWLRQEPAAPEKATSAAAVAETHAATGPATSAGPVASNAAAPARSANLDASAAPAPAGARAARPPSRVKPATQTGLRARQGATAPAENSSEPVSEAELALLGMDALRERVVACTACGLCRGRRHAVFGVGPECARWLVVGEAPGEQEDRQGAPFVGKSGKLLDAMLASVGMSRERDVFIANVIKCRPPGNRNPKPEEIAACRPYLMRQVALVQPELILVLGRFAAQTLLGTDAPVGSLRGQVHTLKVGDREIPVIPSYHPAYLLRSPSEKARSWQDLRLAVSQGAA